MKKKAFKKGDWVVFLENGRWTHPIKLKRGQVDGYVVTLSGGTFFGESKSPVAGIVSTTRVFNPEDSGYTDNSARGWYELTKVRHATKDDFKWQAEAHLARAQAEKKRAKAWMTLAKRAGVK